MTHETIDQEKVGDMDAVVMIESMSQTLRSGGTLGDAYLGTSADERETLYRMGYALYEQGRYSDAFKVFSTLVVHDHREPRFLFALGATCQVLKQYTDALLHYMNAAATNAEDPLPILHAAECLMALKRVPEAIDTLRLVLELCPDPQSALHHRAVTLLQGLQPMP